MEDTNKKKHVIQTPMFDPDYFKVGKAYHVIDGEADQEYNMLLEKYEQFTLNFVYINENGYQVDGYLSIDDYLDDNCTIEELVTVSSICDGMQTIADAAKDEIMKDFVSDQLMVCREVDYENLTDRIIFGEDKVDELMDHIFSVDGAINKFYYKIDNMLINNGSVLKARYYISLEKLDDRYKLHPAFIESDNDEFTVQFVSSDLIRNSYFGIDNGDDGSNEVVTDTSFNRFKGMIENKHNNTKMWNVEIVSALQLIALVELGFKEANNENTTGKNYHGIEHLFDGYFQFVDGLTIKGNEIKVNGNTVCEFSKGILSLSGHIRYFKNIPSCDWLFIPNQTTDDFTNSIRCWSYIKGSDINERVAGLGGYWGLGSYAGLFSWVLDGASSSSGTNIGSRTMID